MSNKITNPTGQGGYTDLQTLLPGIVDSFKAGGTIAAKTIVVIGTTGTVTQAATGSTASLCLGVALEAGVSGESLRVATYGIAEDVLVQGAIVAGDILKRSGTTAGYVAATATPAAGEAIGFAINASAGGTCDVWVCKAL